MDMARKFITYFDKEGEDYTDELILAVKDNKQSILSLSKRFLVEKYISLNKCAKSVREALKKAKTEHYHGKVILRRHSGDEEIVKEF